MYSARNAAIALLLLLSMSACEFFESKPLAPIDGSPAIEPLPDVLVKYAPELPPTRYARATALGPLFSTGSVVGDAANGLRLSAQPYSLSAIDLAAVTPAAWVSDYGTGLQMGEDASMAQGLPFAFSFFGQSYSSIYVSANGHLSFVNPISFKRSWNIPDAANILIAPAYADWMPASIYSFPNLQASRVYVNTVGEAGDRRFVVTWNDMRPCCSLSWPGSSFQVQLLERTGEIVIAYREMQMVVSNSSAGIAADAQRFVRSATGAAVLGLQGCVLTYTPNSGGYREANSCAPEPVNVPPSVEVGGPYSGDEGSSIAVSGSASDENGDALTYTWELGDGATMSGAAVSHIYADNGAYPATLSVSDGELVTVATTRVDVSNVAPSLGALSPASLFIGDSYNVAVAFDDAGENDAPWDWSIEWGDGESSSGSGVNRAMIESGHTYMTAGTYTVRVTVSDKDEAIATAEALVEVRKDEVTIDIKPWDSRNRIYLKGGWDKLIAVAILSDTRLDASTIDVSSVKLENIGVVKFRSGTHGYDNDDDDDDDDDDDNDPPPNTSPSYHYLATLYDIDRDGDRDLLVLFDRKEMIRAGALSKTTTSLTLTGMANGTRKISGWNTVMVIR